MGGILAALMKVLAGAGKGLAAGAAKGGGILKSAGPALMQYGASGSPSPGAQGAKFLGPLFDTLAGTKTQSTGQIGDIAQAARVRNMGVLGKARAGAVQGLQSGLKNAAVSGIGNMGGGGQKQAGGISFPSVPDNSAISLPDLPPLDLPDRSGLAQMRQQILQEILSGGGGGMF